MQVRRGMLGQRQEQLELSAGGYIDVDGTSVHCATVG